MHVATHVYMYTVFYCSLSADSFELWYIRMLVLLNIQASKLTDNDGKMEFCHMWWQRHMYCTHIW